MNKSELPIKIEYPSVQFEQHLNDENNHYILFSGRYGTGKSTFLEHFFKARESEYFSIILKPINYAVSQNEDIFEIIKVDILKCLFTEEKLALEEELKVNKFEALLKFAFQKPLSIAGSILKGISISASLGDVLSAKVNISDLVNKFSEFEKEYNEKLKSAANRSEDFLVDQTGKVGSVFEFNIISQIISNIIESINESGKKTILVIDDLDRIDPEHIFRILNVFSAHNDFRFNDNDNSCHKFGFNKVVLVADKTNLHNIFKHRYGEQTDFEGYIAKFYSKKIFDFSNEHAIINFLNSHEFEYFNSIEIDFLRILLSAFIKKGLLRIRNLMKPPKQEFPNFEIASMPQHLFWGGIDKFISGNILHIDLHDFSFIRPLQYISYCFGDDLAFLESITTMKDSMGFFTPSDTKCFVESIPLLSHFNNKINNLPELFFHIEENNRRAYDYNVSNISNLHLNIFGLDVKINHNWRVGSKYTGESGFFSKHNISANCLMDSSYSFNAVSYMEIFTMIHDFHTNLKNLGLLEKAYN